jgi:hypothetical protein
LIFKSYVACTLFLHSVLIDFVLFGNLNSSLLKKNIIMKSLLISKLS